MSLLAHIMKDRDAADIPVFPLVLEISREIAERYRNMSPAELREAFNIERGSLQVYKPGGSMPSVDSIAKPDEISMKAISDAMKTITGWHEMRQEVLHYLSQGADCFTVSSGLWTIEYDNRKESEVR